MSDEGKPLTLYTAVLTPEQAEKLEASLLGRGWERKEVPYARFAFVGPKVQVSVYTSGKLVVQGKATREFVEMTLEPEILGEANLGYDELRHPDWFEAHAGCDEAGKGDVFGPLVTACVVAGGDAVRAFLKAGVVDSKRLSDSKALDLDEIIRSTPKVAVGVTHASMARYNELMSKPGANLNNLLSWFHSKSLGQALDQQQAPWGLLDQFATRDRVGYYLARPDFELRRRTKAESDPVVAAASIVARAEFLRELKRLGKSMGEKLPKGSSVQAQKTFKRLESEHGREFMADYAKLHFKLRAVE
jgi:ribonuclease HIII